MSNPIILASASQIRSDLLRNAGVPHEILKARIDEITIRQSLQAEGASPRDLADALAEMKARKIADKRPDAMVIGCDQILSLGDQVFGKPATIDEARAHLIALRGQTHMLHSAAVIYQDGKPLWRHVGKVRLSMRDISDAYLDDYLARNWHSIQYSVGGYKLEEEGIRLFTRIEGDYFTILGLPLIDLLSYLSHRGTLPS